MQTMTISGKVNNIYQINGVKITPNKMDEVLLGDWVQVLNHSAMPSNVPIAQEDHRIALNQKPKAGGFKMGETLILDDLLIIESHRKCVTLPAEYTIFSMF
jgi:hypothetical protein